MKRNIYIKFSAIVLLVLMLGSSINLPVIMHECSFSKKKTTHFFSMDHQCKKSHCAIPEKPSKESKITKVPCCTVETSFIQNQDFTSLKAQLSSSHFIVQTSLFSIVLPTKTIEKETILPLEPQLKRYGFQYRIAMQSFLC